MLRNWPINIKWKTLKFRLQKQKTLWVRKYEIHLIINWLLYCNPSNYNSSLLFFLFFIFIKGLIFVNGKVVYFFVNANKNLALSLATHRSLPLKCRFSLWNSPLKKTTIQMSLPKFWAVLSSQAAFSWRNSVQKILSKWLSKRLVRHIILSQKCFKLRNDDIEDSEVENRLEKKIGFADGRVKDVKSIANFSPRRQFCVGPMAWEKHGCQDSFKMAASEVDLTRRIFQDWIQGTSETETSVSWKAECLLAMVEAKK